MLEHVPKIGKPLGMIINNYIQKAEKYALKFINNPCIYIAALIGGLVGLGIGGAAGAVSGGFIGHNLQILDSSVTLPWGINPNMSLGIIIGIGIGIGAYIGATIIGLLTILKIYKKTQSFSTLSNNNIQEVLLSCLGISVELATGMGIGTIIGSLKDPGYGSITGAFIGLILMLLKSAFKDKSLVA